MPFVELKLYTNEVITNERTHLHILGTYIKKIKEKKQWNWEWEKMNKAIKENK